MHNVIFLIGNSQVIKEEKIEHIKSQRFQNASVDFVIFHPDDTSPSSIIEFCKQASFLGNKRIAVIKNANTIKADQKKALQSFLNNLPKSALIILEFMDKKDIKSGGWLTIKADTIECFSPSGGSLFRWIEDRFKSQGRKVSPAIIQTVIDFSLSNADAAWSVIQKVCLYTEGRGDIQVQDVLDVGERNLETDVFRMIRCCLLGDKKGGFKIYLDIVAAGEDTGRITGTISWHARMALMIKILMEQQCYDIPSKLEQSGIKSGAYFFWKDIISGISFQKIKKYASLVEDIEYRIKTGKIPEDVGLEMLLSKM